MNMNEIDIKAARRLDDGNDLKYHSKHAVEITFTRPVNNDVYEREAVEGLAAIYTMDTYVKSKPYPFHIEADVTVNSDVAIVYWTEDDEERFIAPKNDSEGEYFLWSTKNVGDIIFFESGAPGIGHAKFRVDRKDDTGLWGICIEDTRWIPDGDFYR